MNVKTILPAILANLVLSYTISAQCNAGFTVSDFGGGTYQFAASYTGQQGYTYSDQWDMGGYGIVNGQSSIIQNFMISGTYSICHVLIVQDSAGTTICNDTSCRQVLATVPQSCIGANGFYVYFNQTPATPSGVFSNSLTDYTNLRLVWSFGDGTSVTGVASPAHTYSAFGTYTYCLTATDTVLNCTYSSCNSLLLDSSTCTHYDYITYYQTDLSNNTLQINDVYTGNSNVVYNWTFGDSTSFTGTYSVSHSFPASGSYNVCVTSVDTLTQCSTSFCTWLNVDTCSAAFADFTWSPETNSPNQLSVMLDSTIPGGSAVTWLLPNATVNDFNVYALATYPAAGVYQACVNVQIPGCSAVQSCNQVIVACNLDDNFTYTMINGNTISYTPELASYYQNVDTNVVYHWLFGDGAVSTEIYPTHVYSDTGAYTTCLIVTDTLFGCSDTLCQQVVYYPWTDTICGTVFIDLNGNGIQDSGEAGQPNVQVSCYTGIGPTITLVTDSNGYYQSLVPGGQQYFSLYLYNGAYLPLSLPFFYNYYSFSFNQPNQRQCGFDFALMHGVVPVGGTVFGDDNHNGVWDNNEGGIPNQLVDLGSQQVVTLSTGLYLAYLDTGNYTIQKDASGFFASYSTLPASIPLSITNYNAVDTGLNIGVQTTPGIHDVAVDLVPLTPVSPGQISFYAVQVTNLSNATETVTDSMTNDPLMPLTYYEPFNSYNSATNTVYWNYYNLQPFGIVSDFAADAADASLVYNRDIYNWAGVTLNSAQDNNPNNNVDTCHQIVISPFDPNSKQSNQAGRTALGYIKSDQEIKYSIEFQNTGNSDAINVIVKDILDPGFDLKTFRFIGSSAAFATCDVRLVGDTVYFRFSEMMLPPSSINPTGSIGWVYFSIKPKANLPNQTALHNTASIYFDRNAPIQTNTTLHTIEGPLAIQNIVDDGELYLAPNPFSTQLNFRLQNMPGDKYNYTVTDLLGRTITGGTVMTGQTATLYRNTLSAGTYLITFYNSEGIVKRGKIVAE